MELVKHGIMWRVGNGTSISVWHDNWIPRESSRKPFTPDLNQFGDIAVSNLLNPQGTNWDVGLLNSLFWEEDVEYILQIPIAGNHNTDDRRWFFSRSGYYSVKSAYYITRDIKKSRQAALSSSGSVTTTRNWSYIWKLRLPNTLKVFVWRLLKNGLPVTSNLVRRNISIDNVCPICKEAEETTIHAFHSCHFTRLFWALSALPATVLMTPVHDMWTWFSSLKQDLEHVDFERFICCCWVLWNNRNAVLHGSECRDPHEMISFAGNYRLRYEEARIHFDIITPPEAAVYWSPPTAPFVKLNVDASMVGDLTGIGVVARNHLGMC